MATATADGSAITVLDAGSTTGAALPGAVTAAGANSTVILSGTFNTTAITTLQAGQTLRGGGPLTVRSPSGRTATVTLPGATIASTVGGNNPTVAMAANSSLIGITVSHTAGGGSVAIDLQVASGGATATVNGNTMSATGATTLHGINFIGPVTVSGSGNTLAAGACTTTAPVTNSIGLAGGATCP